MAGTLAHWTRTVTEAAHTFMHLADSKTSLNLGGNSCFTKALGIEAQDCPPPYLEPSMIQLSFPLKTGACPPTVRCCLIPCCSCSLVPHVCGQAPAVVFPAGTAASFHSYCKLLLPTVELRLVPCLCESQT